MAHVFHADGCSMGRMASVGPHLRPHRVASNINTANCHPQPAAMADPGDAEYERALEALSGSGRAANGSAADVAGGPGFDWLIYGDDDVAFMWPGLLSMLEGLDPQQPYFLTGALAAVAKLWRRT